MCSVLYTRGMTQNSTAADLTAALPDFFVTETPRGWVDIHVHPERALRDNLDFVRVVEDDGTFRVISLTHNEILKGEVTLSGSMTGLLLTVVREILEAL